MTSTRHRLPLLPSHPYLQTWAGRPCRSATRLLQAGSEPGSTDQTRGSDDNSRRNGGAASGSGVSPQSGSGTLTLDMDMFEQDKEFSRRYRRTVRCPHSARVAACRVPVSPLK